MCLFAVMRTVSESFGTIIGRRASEEAMRERFIALLVPLEVANHFFLLHEDTRIARKRIAVKVFPVIELAAESVTTLGRITVSTSTQVG